VRRAPIRVLLVDDHPLVRSGLRAVLHNCPEITVVGEAGGGHAAVSMAARLRPEVIVMDLEMPDGDGLTATRALRVASPDSLVLIVTMSREREKLQLVLDAGARGHLCTSTADKELVDAILVVAAGDVYVRPALPQAFASSRAEMSYKRHRARAQMERLSDPERTVVVLTARGLDGPEIGRQLGISTISVDRCKHRIEEKLGLARRTDYVRLALEADLLG